MPAKLAAKNEEFLLDLSFTTTPVKESAPSTVEAGLLNVIVLLPAEAM